MEKVLPEAAEPAAVVVAGDGGGDGGVAASLRGDGDARPSAAMVPLSWLAGGSVVVALFLFGLRQSLRLPSGFDIEDVLGWSSPDAVQAAVSAWCSDLPLRWHAAAAYVLTDTAVFMPLYGALILAAATGLRHVLQTGPAPLARVLDVALLPAAWLAVSALWIVDAVENRGGAERVGVGPLAWLASLLLGAGLFVVLWTSVTAPAAPRARKPGRNGAALGAVLAGVAVLVWSQGEASPCAGEQAVRSADYGLAWAHRHKPAAMLLAVAPVAFAAVAWWFGLDLDGRDPAQADAARRRAAWRSGVLGVVGRSRYVIAVLVLFAVFTLVLDQCRDVLLALASPAAEGESRGALALAWQVLVIGAGALGIAALAHSCWLWTRLVSMVQRPDIGLPADAGAFDAIGAFARGWARAMAIAPLVMTAALIAWTAGDAVAAARQAEASGELAWTLSCLFGTGLAVALAGLGFVQVRRRLALARPADYYNSEPDVGKLLRGAAHRGREARRLAGGPGDGVPAPAPRDRADRPGDSPGSSRRPLARIGRVMAAVARPVVLPVAALVAMVVLRIGVAWFPDEASQAPATLALLCLGLAWWSGVLGLLALYEQRQTIPWGLALLAVAGVIGFLGLAGNHVLPLTLVAGSSAAVGAARPAWAAGGIAVLLLLAAAAAAWWTLMTAAGAPRRRLRWTVAGLALAGLLAGLHVVDRSTAAVAAAAVPPTGRTLEQAIEEWSTSLPAAGADNRIFLVASEGGGIRSAYWTARVLALLHERIPDFERRTFALSGVSGGAFGEAVYRACLRSHPGRSGPRECVEQGFRRLDPLSPLVGGLLFEDVFATLLPVRRRDGALVCAQPGCGFLSRAAPFEREWMRRFPHLADALGPARPGEPELLLNSTWVESGNRAVMSTVRLSPRDIPASEDVARRLGAEPSLVGAAHAAARFPYVNPIAALRPAPGASGAGRVVGHLADGGYHDNSGTASVADVWRALRDRLPAPWEPQLVVIRNGQPQAGCLQPPREGPEAGCLRRGQARLADPREPLDRARIDLYIDLLGPAVTAFNVSGIGAHGRQPAGALVQEIAGRGMPCPDPAAAGRSWLFDQTDEGTLVPLGWYLSPAARRALAVQADRRLQEVTTSACRQH